MANSKSKFVFIPGRGSHGLSHHHPDDEVPPPPLNGSEDHSPPDPIPRPVPGLDPTSPSTDPSEANRQRQQKIDALMRAISRVLTPVMICMALAVWLVHSLADPELCRTVAKTRVLPEILLEPPNPESTTTGNPPPTEELSSSYNALAAAIFIGVFIVLMVLFTFLLVWLYKNGKAKFIMGWLIVAVALIFAYVGGLYIFDFCRSRCIALDWVTLSVAVWNFTITGLISVFGLAPRLINQAYLIVMSALMAYIFRTLPSWSVWVILAVLVVWDLFAVLSRHGPLNMLINIAKTRNDALPALVYDTNPDSVGRDEGARPAIMLPKKKKKKPRSSANEGNYIPHITTDSGESVVMDTDVEMNSSCNEVMRRRRELPEHAEHSEDDDSETVAEEQPATAPEPEEREESIQVGTLGTHLKLGLGDFVFYSILVAQASQEGAMTTVASIIAILAGLSVTLVLVTTYRRALPALPISICAGLIFHFLTRITLQPLLEEITSDLILF